MYKVVRFLELMWLVIGILCFCIATYFVFFVALDDGLFFYVFGGLALLLFFLRRRQRKGIEKNTQ